VAGTLRRAPVAAQLADVADDVGHPRRVQPMLTVEGKENQAMHMQKVV